MSKKISMDLDEFVAEHEHLIDILRKAGLDKEADKQEQELKTTKEKYMAGESFDEKIEKRLSSKAERERMAEKIIKANPNASVDQLASELYGEDFSFEDFKEAKEVILKVKKQKKLASDAPGGIPAGSKMKMAAKETEKIRLQKANKVLGLLDTASQISREIEGDAPGLSQAINKAYGLVLDAVYDLSHSR